MAPLPRMARPDWRWFWAIVGLAAVLRLGYFVGHARTIYAWQPIFDAQYYFEAACRFAQREDALASSAFHPPFYSALLGLVFRALHDTVRLPFAYLLNHAFGVLATALTFLTGFAVAGRWPACIAAALLATLGPFVAQGNEAIPSTLLALEIIAIARLLILSAHSRDLEYPLWAGCVFALAAQTAPIVYVLLPWIWARLATQPLPRRGIGASPRPLDGNAAAGLGRLASPLTFTLPLLIGPLFYGMATQAQTGHFTPFPTRGGIYFYLANEAMADGVSARRIETRPEATDRQRDPADILAQQEYERRAGDTRADPAPASPGRVCCFWYAEGAREIARAPVRWLSFMAAKAMMTISHHEGSQQASYAFCRQINPFARWWPSSMGLVILLAIVGLAPCATVPWIWPRHWLWLLTAGYGVGLVFFFVNSQTRQPILPVVCVMAGIGALRLHRLMARTSRRRKMLPVGVPALLALGAAIFGDWFGVARGNVGRDWWRYGYAAAQAGQNELAALACDEALARGEGNSLLYLYRGRLYSDAGRQREAELYYTLAIQSDAEYGRPYFEIGMQFIRRGDARRAAAYLKAAVLRDPHEADYLAELGMLASRARDAEGRFNAPTREYATDLLRRARAWNPYNITALVALSECERQAGDAESARALLERAYGLDPAQTRLLLETARTPLAFDILNIPAFSLHPSSERGDPGDAPEADA